MCIPSLYILRLVVLLFIYKRGVQHHTSHRHVEHQTGFCYRERDNSTECPQGVGYPMISRAMTFLVLYLHPSFHISWIGYESLHCRSSYDPAMSPYIYLMTHILFIASSSHPASPRFTHFPLLRTCLTVTWGIPRGATAGRVAW